jgi:DNA-binding CsgD family transcriptional regulator/PAS domain-containing protein
MSSSVWFMAPTFAHQAAYTGLSLLRPPSQKPEARQAFVIHGAWFIIMHKQGHQAKLRRSFFQHVNHFCSALKQTMDNQENSGRATNPTQQYNRAILDSLSAHIAILDENGVILQTNRAWMEFASANRIGIRPDTLRVNYLAICDAAQGESAPKAHQVAEGIRSVIKGEIEEYTMDYPCHSPDQERWFYMRATRSVDKGPLRVVVSHENITALKIAENRLRLQQEELQKNAETLQETNAALRVVLHQHDQDRKELEQVFYQNLKEAIQPYLERLKQLEHDPAKAELLDLIESGIDEVYSPFLRRLSLVKTGLTPQEIQVAHLVRAGKSSKEIADLLSLSVNTVSFHRRNLRDKLDIKNSSINLRTYLLSLE